jgi:hypothetical protein
MITRINPEEFILQSNIQASGLPAGGIASVRSGSSPFVKDFHAYQHCTSLASGIAFFCIRSRNPA